MKPITKVILAAHLGINLPSIVISFALPILVFHSVETLWIKLLLTGGTFLLTLFVLLVFWSFTITKWRLWAFSKVPKEDWLKLKKAAIKNYIIWNDKTGMHKNEFRTEADLTKLEEIFIEINEQEQLSEIKLDLATPGEIRYPFDKLELSVELFSKCLVLVFCVFALFTKIYLVGIILFLFVAYGLKSLKYTSYLFDEKDCLVINKQGIYFEFPEAEFISWDEIQFIAIGDKKSKIKLLIGEEGEERVFDLNYYKIKDHELFMSQVKIFLDRRKLDYEVGVD